MGSLAGLVDVGGPTRKIGGHQIVQGTVVSHSDVVAGDRKVGHLCTDVDGVGGDIGSRRPNRSRPHLREISAQVESDVAGGGRIQCIQGSDNAIIIAAGVEIIDDGTEKIGGSGIGDKGVPGEKKRNIPLHSHRLGGTPNIDGLKDTDQATQGGEGTVADNAPAFSRPSVGVEVQGNKPALRGNLEISHVSTGDAGIGKIPHAAQGDGVAWVGEGYGICPITSGQNDIEVDIGHQGQIASVESLKIHPILCHESEDSATERFNGVLGNIDRIGRRDASAGSGLNRDALGIDEEGPCLSCRCGNIDARPHKSDLGRLLHESAVAGITGTRVEQAPQLGNSRPLRQNVNLPTRRVRSLTGRRNHGTTGKNCMSLRIEDHPTGVLRDDAIGSNLTRVHHRTGRDFQIGLAVSLNDLTGRRYGRGHHA